RDLIRVAKSSGSKPLLKVGTKVEAKYRGKTFYPGKVVRVNSDGSYDIDYDDGEKEKRVVAEHVRRRPTGHGGSDDNSDDTLRVGTKVEAKYKGRTFYPGKIAKVHSNGTYDIDYDDGEKETKVDRELIRVTATTFKVGAAIDARVNGSSKYRPGQVRKGHTDGTYDVELLDGEVVKRVAADCLREREDGSGGSDDGVSSWAVGDRVVARIDGAKTALPGRVTKVLSNGTYDVALDNGTRATRVPARRLAPAPAAFHTGDAVAVHVQGKSVKGTVSRVHGDGRCDVRLASGDTKRKVDAEALEKASAASSSASSDDDKEPSVAWVKGMRVAFRKHPTRRGTVTRVHGSDGSCDVMLADGGVQARIPQTQLVPSASSSDEAVKPKPHRHRFKFKRGQPVESQWKRRTNAWCRGTVVAKQVDGTYTVRYQDGTVADNAPEGTLRAVVESSSDEEKPPPPVLTPDDERFYLQQLLLTLYEEGEILPKTARMKPKAPHKAEGNAKDTPREADSSMANSTPRGSKSSDGDSSAGSKSPRETPRKKPPTEDDGKADSDSSATAPEDPPTPPGGPVTEKELRFLLGAPYITKCRNRFEQFDKLRTGTLSLRQAELAIQSLRTLYRPGQVAAHLSRFPPLTFLGFMAALAYATYCDAKADLAQHMDMEAIHASRFASKHERKRQVQLWQTKLGFRVFERLTHDFQAHATLTGGAPQVTVEAASAVVSSVGRHLVPKKPLQLYWAQLHLLPHHLLTLSEVCCVFYQLYGSLDGLQEAHRLEASLELRPVAFVAACMYSNGDDCNHHEVVRRLSMGRLPVQVDMIYRIQETFEALCDERQQLAVAQVETLLRSLSVPADVVGPSLLLFRHQTSVCLVELFAILGHTLVDALDAVPSIANAVSRLRLREAHADVKKILDVCRTLLHNVLRFPNNRDYWRIRCDTPAYQHRLGRFRGTPALLEAMHFVQMHGTHYELRGARSATGVKATVLSASTLALLKEALDAIEQEICHLEGGVGVRDVVQESMVQYHHSVPEVRAALELALVYLTNILKHPKVSKYWRIRATNKVFAAKIGALTNALALMQVLGFDFVEAAEGGYFELRQAAARRPSSNDPPLAHFTFPALTEHTEWFLWRRKEDIEGLLDEGAKQAPTPLLVVATEADLASDSSQFPYGLNTRSLFGKSDVQALQIEMIDAVFQHMDKSRRGYLSLQDLQHYLSPSVGIPADKMMSFLDLDRDGHVTADEFVASFGPLLDHSYTLCPSVGETGLSLCETVSAKIGALRVSAQLHVARRLLTDILSFVDALLAQPTDPRSWRIELTKEAPLLHHSDECKELLTVLGLEMAAVVVAPALPKPSEPMHPETVAEQEAKEAQPTPVTKHVLFLACTKEKSCKLVPPPTLARLRTMRSIVFGHMWGMSHPSISDVGATTRGLLHHLRKRRQNLTPWVAVVRALQELLSHMVANPADPSFRRIAVASPGFMTTVGNVVGATEWFIATGFHETTKGDLEYAIDAASPLGWQAEAHARLLEVDIALAYLEQAVAPPPTTAPPATIDAIQDPAAKQLVLNYQKKAQLAQMQKERVQQHNAQLTAQRLGLAQSTMAGDAVVTVVHAPPMPPEASFKLLLGGGLPTAEERIVASVDALSAGSERVLHLASALQYAHAASEGVTLTPLKSKKRHFDLWMYLKRVVWDELLTNVVQATLPEATTRCLLPAAPTSVVYGTIALGQLSLPARVIIEWDELVAALDGIIASEPALALATDAVSIAIARLAEVCRAPADISAIEAALSMDDRARRRLRRYASTHAVPTLTTQWWRDLEYYLRTKAPYAPDTPRLFPITKPLSTPAPGDGIVVDMVATSTHLYVLLQSGTVHECSLTGALKSSSAIQVPRTDPYDGIAKLAKLRRGFGSAVSIVVSGAYGRLVGVNTSVGLECVQFFTTQPLARSQTIVLSMLTSVRNAFASTLLLTDDGTSLIVVVNALPQKLFVVSMASEAVVGVVEHVPFSKGFAVHHALVPTAMCVSGQSGRVHLWSVASMSVERTWTVAAVGRMSSLVACGAHYVVAAYDEPSCLVLWDKRNATALPMHIWTPIVPVTALEVMTIGTSELPGVSCTVMCAADTLAEALTFPGVVKAVLYIFLDAVVPVIASKGLTSSWITLHRQPADGTFPPEVWFDRGRICRIAYVTLLTASITLSDLLDGYGFKRVLLETYTTIERFLELHNLPVRVALFYTAQDGPMTKCHSPIAAASPVPLTHVLGLHSSRGKLQWVYPYRATVVPPAPAVQTIAEAHLVQQLNRHRLLASVNDRGAARNKGTAINIGAVELFELYLHSERVEVGVSRIQDCLGQALWHPGRFESGMFLSVVRWVLQWWRARYDGADSVATTRAYEDLSIVQPPACLVFWQAQMLSAVEGHGAPTISEAQLLLYTRKIHARHFSMPEVYAMVTAWHAVFPVDATFDEFAAFVAKQLHPPATECSPAVVTQWMLQLRQYVTTLPYGALDELITTEEPSLLHSYVHWLRHCRVIHRLETDGRRLRVVADRSIQLKPPARNEPAAPSLRQIKYHALVDCQAHCSVQHLRSQHRWAYTGTGYEAHTKLKRPITLIAMANTTAVEHEHERKLCVQLANQPGVASAFLPLLPNAVMDSQAPDDIAYWICAPLETWVPLTDVLHVYPVRSSTELHGVLGLWIQQLLDACYVLDTRFELGLATWDVIALLVAPNGSHLKFWRLDGALQSARSGVGFGTVVASFVQQLLAFPATTTATACADFVHALSDLAQRCRSFDDAPREQLKALVAQALSKSSPPALSLDIVKWRQRLEQGIVAPIADLAQRLDGPPETPIDVAQAVRTLESVVAALSALAHTWQPTCPWQLALAVDWLVVHRGLVSLVDVTLRLYNQLRASDRRAATDEAVLVVQQTLAALLSWLQAPPTPCADDDGKGGRLIAAFVCALSALATGETLRWDPYLWRVCEPALAAVIGLTKDARFSNVFELLQLYFTCSDTFPPHYDALPADRATLPVLIALYKTWSVWFEIATMVPAKTSSKAKAQAIHALGNSAGVASVADVILGAIYYQTPDIVARTWIEVMEMHLIFVQLLRDHDIHVLQATLTLIEVALRPPCSEARRRLGASITSRGLQQALVTIASRCLTQIKLHPLPQTTVYQHVLLLTVECWRHMVAGGAALTRHWSATHVLRFLGRHKMPVLLVKSQLEAVYPHILRCQPTPRHCQPCAFGQILDAVRAQPGHLHLATRPTPLHDVWRLCADVDNHNGTLQEQLSVMQSVAANAGYYAVHCSEDSALLGTILDTLVAWTAAAWMQVAFRTPSRLTKDQTAVVIAGVEVLEAFAAMAATSAVRRNVEAGVKSVWSQLHQHSTSPPVPEHVAVLHNEVLDTMTTSHKYLVDLPPAAVAVLMVPPLGALVLNVWRAWAVMTKPDVQAAIIACGICKRIALEWCFGCDEATMALGIDAVAVTVATAVDTGSAQEMARALARHGVAALDRRRPSRLWQLVACLSKWSVPLAMQLESTADIPPWVLTYHQCGVLVPPKSVDRDIVGFWDNWQRANILDSSFSVVSPVAPKALSAPSSKEAPPSATLSVHIASTPESPHAARSSPSPPAKRRGTNDGASWVPVYFLPALSAGSTLSVHDVVSAFRSAVELAPQECRVREITKDKTTNSVRWSVSIDPRNTRAIAAAQALMVAPWTCCGVPVSITLDAPAAAPTATRPRHRFPMPQLVEAMGGHIAILKAAFDSIRREADVLPALWTCRAKCTSKQYQQALVRCHGSEVAPSPTFGTFVQLYADLSGLIACMTRYPDHVYILGHPRRSDLSCWHALSRTLHASCEVAFSTLAAATPGHLSLDHVWAAVVMIVPALDSLVEDVGAVITQTARDEMWRGTVTKTEFALVMSIIHSTFHDVVVFPSRPLVPPPGTHVTDAIERDVALLEVAPVIETAPPPVTPSDDLYSNFTSSDSDNAARSEPKPRKKQRDRRSKQVKREDASGSSSDSSSSSSTTGAKRRRKAPSPKAFAPAPVAEVKPRVSHKERTLRQVFNKYDSNGDGVLCFADMRKALSSTELTDVEIRQWLLEHDGTGVGRVSFADFVTHYNPASTRERVAPPPIATKDDIYAGPKQAYEGGSYRLGGVPGDAEQRRKLRRLFDSYDYDGDGKVTAKDLRKVFRQQGRNDVTDEMIVEWIAQKDTKHQEAVDLDDFLRSYDRPMHGHEVPSRLRQKSD
ncbi:hypothetical protein ACHHYP_04747, partial [Achlya hypogyna]